MVSLKYLSKNNVNIHSDGTTMFNIAKFFHVSIHMRLCWFIGGAYYNPPISDAYLLCYSASFSLPGSITHK